MTKRIENDGNHDTYHKKGNSELKKRENNMKNERKITGGWVGVGVKTYCFMRVIGLLVVPSMGSF